MYISEYNKIKLFSGYGTELMGTLVHLYRNEQWHVKAIVAREEALVTPPVCQELERPDKQVSVAPYD